MSDTSFSLLLAVRISVGVQNRPRMLISLSLVFIKSSKFDLTHFYTNSITPNSTNSSAANTQMLPLTTKVAALTLCCSVLAVVSSGQDQQQPQRWIRHGGSGVASPSTSPYGNSSLPGALDDGIVNIQLACNAANMTLSLETGDGLPFAGLIYPLGLGRNSRCMRHFDQHFHLLTDAASQAIRDARHSGRPLEAAGLRRHKSARVHYTLPLHGCNTMNTEQNGGVEFYNTVVVQPQRHLVTNRGLNYQLSCTYSQSDNPNSVVLHTNGHDATSPPKQRHFTWTKYDGTSVNEIFYDKHAGLYYSTWPAVASELPRTAMHIYRGDPSDGVVAREVHIGEPLSLVVTAETVVRPWYDVLRHEFVNIPPDETDDALFGTATDVYGIHVTDCRVSDGLNTTEQLLIDDRGCPVDWDIMGEVAYSESHKTALAQFKAHKFPDAEAVYYQCNITLCFRYASPHHHPYSDCQSLRPDCYNLVDNNLGRHHRMKRELREVSMGAGAPMVQVFSGLNVKEATDLDRLEKGSRFDLNPDGVPIMRVPDPSLMCFNQHDFAVGIAFAGIILILLVVVAIFCLLSRRTSRYQKDMMSVTTTSGSSTIYSASSRGGGGYLQPVAVQSAASTLSRGHSSNVGRQHTTYPTPLHDHHHQQYYG